MRKAVQVIFTLFLAGSASLSIPPASAGTETLRFSCQGGFDADENPLTMAMENEYIQQSGYGPCWFHTGHHTYDLDGLFSLETLTGRVFTVEARYSPPIEASGTDLAALPVEASLDGISWERVGSIVFALQTDRQERKFTIAGNSVAARYVRIRQPRSAAQGWSGYLDSSNVNIEATPLPEEPPQQLTGEVEFTCENDIMERFDSVHPCWAGGINRYDSPSVFHTYPLGGPQQISAITGSATFLPWRSDDYTQNAGDRRRLNAHVFASNDGEHWTKIHTFPAEYGLAAAIQVPGAPPAETAYLRVVAEYHTGVTTHPALKHVRGMIYDSSLRVTFA